MSPLCWCGQPADVTHAHYEPIPTARPASAKPTWDDMDRAARDSKEHWLELQGMRRERDEARAHIECLCAAIETLPVANVPEGLELERKRARDWLEGKAAT